MQGGDDVGEVTHVTVFARILEQGTEHIGVCGGVRRANLYVPAKRFGAGSDHVDGLGQAVFVNKEGVGLVLAHRALGHRHGFGGGGAFVQQGRVGQFHAGHVDDHLLEVQQRFQTALGNLWLIRCVSGVPARIFHHVAQDDRRNDGVVVTQTDVALENLVAVGQRAQVRQRLEFGFAVGDVQKRLAQQVSRHNVGGQGVQSFSADGVQHGGGFVVVQAGTVRGDMATDKVVALFQLMQ